MEIIIQLVLKDPSQISLNFELDELVIAFRDEEKMDLFQSKEGGILDKKYFEFKIPISKQKQESYLGKLIEGATTCSSYAMKIAVVSSIIIFLVTQKGKPAEYMYRMTSAL